jgi:hypothetical protein
MKTQKRRWAFHRKKESRRSYTLAEAARFAKGEEHSRYVFPDGPSERGHGFAIPAQFIDPEGLVSFKDVAKSFGMSAGQLASTVGVQIETVHRVERAKAPKPQSRVREMLEIVGRIADWAGGKEQAMAWYKAEPLPAFGGRTAEALVKEGKAAAVRDYLDHIARGGFA